MLICMLITSLSFESPVGLITVMGTSQALTEVRFGAAPAEAMHEQPSACVRQATEQLQEYLQGLRTHFDLPLSLPGTRFQQQVWHCLAAIPYGHTVSYKELARMAGRPKAFRAVGGANNKNPLPIILPCHRVIGSNGQLVGYGSGVWRKQWLLELEKAIEPDTEPRASE